MEVSVLQDNREIKLEVGNYIETYNKRKLDSNIMTRIMDYTYGEKRTEREIAENVGLHILKTKYYLDYMVFNGYLACCEKEAIDGISYKVYWLNTKNIETDIHISGQLELRHQAKQIGKSMENMILRMKKDNINYAKGIGVFLTENYANKVKLEIKKLYDLIEKYELLSEQEFEEKKKFNFLSAFVSDK